MTSLPREGWPCLSVVWIASLFSLLPSPHVLEVKRSEYPTDYKLLHLGTRTMLQEPREEKEGAGKGITAYLAIHISLHSKLSDHFTVREIRIRWLCSFPFLPAIRGIFSFLLGLRITDYGLDWIGLGFLLFLFLLLFPLLAFARFSKHVS